MIIDSHHHLWKYNPEEYGWMDDSMQVLKRNYLPGDLEAEMKKSGVEGTVVVQARQTLGETEWLLDLAQKNSFIYGVVGWMDLVSPQFKDQLETYATHPKLVGLRHVIHDESDDDFMLKDDFRQGISLLQTFNLVYDLLLFPKHLGQAFSLVEEFPEQRFVLDHLAKPLIAAGTLEPWKTDLEKLASLPNVWCKISGMVTEADHQHWEINDFIPYMEVVLNSFGRERIMLGSDWPVCRLAGEYEEVLNIPLIFSRHLDAEGKERLLSKNAIECYQLQTEL